MFKRLYAVGGVWYVLGGLGVLAMSSMPITFGLVYFFGIKMPESILDYSLYALFIGGAVCTLVFNSGSMQVVAQNRTTDMLEKMSQQLDERDADVRRSSRRRHRQSQHKRSLEESKGSIVVNSCSDVANPILEKSAPQEGYVCPVSKTFIPVRD